MVRNKLEVALVSMPFGAIHLPSAGLSVLKPTLAGLPSKIFYFTFPFAVRIGVGLYESITLRTPEEALAGEWIFRPGLFECTAGQDEAYVEAVLRRQTEKPIPEDVISGIVGSRRAVPDFLDECVRRVLDCEPRIVAFTTVFQQHVASLALARRLKETAPGIFVVLGGANCEGPMGPETARQFPFLDAVVSGEGDRVFPELVGRLLNGESLSGLEGVHTRDSTAFGATPLSTPPVRDLDTLPYPDFDDFFEQYRESPVAALVQPRLPFETSRGCWWGQVHHCTFCGLNGNNMAFRAKSASRALNELDFLTRRYPGYSLMVTDNILDLNYFKAFVPGVARRASKVRLFYEVKANLKKEQLRLLRAAGITQIQPGIESLSDEVLQLMRKGIRGLQNIQLLKWCQELGIWPLWLMIWGFPGESPEEYRRVAGMIPLLSHLPPPRAEMTIRLDRFSPNYESRDDLGFSNVRPAQAYGHVYPFPPGVLNNLAYFFDYDYQAPRDVGAYTRELKELIRHWREAYPRSGLYCEDRGDALWVWDFRDVAARELTILSGVESVLYRACDEVRGMTSLRKYADAERVEEIVRRLVDLRLVLREADSVLSLAVRAPAAGSLGWDANPQPGSSAERRRKL